MVTGLFLTPSRKRIAILVLSLGLGHDYFLPNPFHLIIHNFFHIFTLHNPIQLQRRGVNGEEIEDALS
jgi:hypothetical protein